MLSKKNPNVQSLLKIFQDCFPTLLKQIDKHTQSGNVTQNKITPHILRNFIKPKATYKKMRT